ncbi:hypothetical protein FPQ18DRAFT_390279 [Pyronema domesticum]|nr:hypothetical protein FPQ18DRAFT_390279 [Pyronema domesticum]
MRLPRIFFLVLPTSLLDFAPGLIIPSLCLKNFTPTLCPARLPSGNALLTSANTFLIPRGMVTKPNNLFLCGASKEGIETSTTVLFSFPSGYSGRKCRFQLITSDDGPGSPTVGVDVFSLQPPTGGQGLKIFLTSDPKEIQKPERQAVVARFIVGGNDDAVLVKKGKIINMNTGSSRVLEFKCPEGGDLAFEVVAVGKGIVKVEGNTGLGIEVLGVKSGWWFQIYNGVLVLSHNLLFGGMETSFLYEVLLFQYTGVEMSF